MNDELKSLFEQDQADRKGWQNHSPEQIEQMVQRDRERRQRVGELIASGTLQAPEDYFHAAMIFQHGETIGTLLASP